MTNFNDINKILALKTIEEKIFKYKSLYHPNLVANLSEDAYDLYSVRDSICNQLLDVLNKRTRNIDEVKKFIREKISELEIKLNNSKDELQSRMIKLVIDEWKAFLSSTDLNPKKP